MRIASTLLLAIALLASGCSPTPSVTRTRTFEPTATSTPDPLERLRSATATAPPAPPPPCDTLNPPSPAVTKVPDLDHRFVVATQGVDGVNGGDRLYPIEEIVLWDLDAERSTSLFRVGGLYAYPERVWLRDRIIVVVYEGTRCGSDGSLTLRLEAYGLDGHVIRSTLLPHGHWPYYSALSGDAKRVAVVGAGAVEVADASTGASVLKVPNAALPTVGGAVPSPLAWASDDRTLLGRGVGTEYGGPPFAIDDQGRSVASVSEAARAAAGGVTAINRTPSACEWTGVLALTHDYGLPRSYDCGSASNGLSIDGRPAGITAGSLLGVIVGLKP